MKPYIQVACVLAGIVFCLLGTTLPAKPPSISYEGGDGSSAEKAIVIKGAKGEQDGVHSEYEYLAKHFPGCKRGAQSLQHLHGKSIDVLEFTTAGGEKKTIYFDITAFFGK